MAYEYVYKYNKDSNIQNWESKWEKSMQNRRQIKKKLNIKQSWLWILNKDLYTNSIPFNPRYILFVVVEQIFYV